MGAREGYSFNKCGIWVKEVIIKKTCKTRQHILIIYICSKWCKLQLLFLIQLYRCSIILQKLIFYLYKTPREAWFRLDEVLLPLWMLTVKTT
jgi:hypothetical protein